MDSLMNRIFHVSILISLFSADLICPPALADATTEPSIMSETQR
jgi:hypothetical protein